VVVTLHPDVEPTTIVVEWRAQIRGREVACRWGGDQFVGDGEVVDRLSRVVGRPPRASSLEEARELISCALIDFEELPIVDVQEQP